MIPDQGIRLWPDWGYSTSRITQQRRVLSNASASSKPLARDHDRFWIVERERDGNRRLLLSPIHTVLQR
jgi:hypothetical protein